MTVQRAPLARAVRDRSGYGQVWLITFADLIALLLAFFVMIYATQKLEHGAWETLAKSLSQSLNPEREHVERVPSAERNMRLRSQPHAIDLDYLETLLAGTVSQEPSLNGVTLQNLGDRLVIALPSELLFRSGEASPIPVARRAIAALAAVLRNIGNRIDVYGHTDPEPVSGTRYASNWDLSLARARSVSALLRASGYGRRIAAYGLADSRFAELRDIEPRERRYQLARRVDIVVRPARERY